MYGTLGYIDNGRRAAPRDSGFLGATSNPARRDFYGARRPEPPGSAMGGAAANTLALLERRCIFLEEQDKRRMAEVADLRARLNDARVETVRATVLEATVQAREPDAPTSDPVPAGARVQLQYPMKRVRAGDATQVWMRRREVDPDLGSVEYRWLLLFEEREGAPDRVLVGEFS